MYELATSIYPVATTVIPSILWLVCGGGLFGAVAIFFGLKVLGK